MLYRKRWYLLPSLFLLCWACQPTTTTQQASIEAADLHQTIRKDRYDSLIYPAMQRAVKSGDMVLRLGTDITSEMLRQMNRTDKRYSHCGIASIEQDTVFVYHAIGGEFNPDQRIKRELLYSFCYPADNKAAAIVRPRFTHRSNTLFASRAHAYWQQGIPFDMGFDYQTDDRFYCAEFVAKTIVRSVADSSWFAFSNTGNLQYVGVDNLFLSPVMHFITEFSY